MEKILIVEDDVALNKALTYNMKMDGYEVISVVTVEDAIQKVTSEQIDLIILDVNLPDGDGYSLCRQIKKNVDIPILFLTANDMESDIIKGYEIGAEDYITKPFVMNVFRKKIVAILRRLNSKEEQACFFDDGHLKLDFFNRKVQVDGKEIKVAASDFKLLQILSSATDRIFSKEMLVDLIWQGKDAVFEHAVTESIHRIRSKIESPEYTYIKTVYGMGYTWIGTDNEKN